MRSRADIAEEIVTVLGRAVDADALVPVIERQSVAMKPAIKQLVDQLQHSRATARLAAECQHDLAKLRRKLKRLPDLHHPVLPPPVNLGDLHEALRRISADHTDRGRMSASKHSGLRLRSDGSRAHPRIRTKEADA